MIFANRNTTPVKPTVQDIAGERDGIKVNFTKLNEAIKKCQTNKEDKSCREKMKELGIEWIDNQ